MLTYIMAHAQIFKAIKEVFVGDEILTLFVKKWHLRIFTALERLKSLRRLN